MVWNLTKPKAKAKNWVRADLIPMAKLKKGMKVRTIALTVLAGNKLKAGFTDHIRYIRADGFDIGQNRSTFGDKNRSLTAIEILLEED